MMAKILLSLGLLWPLVFIYLQSRPIRFLRLSLTVIIGIGLVLVWNPELSTRIAHMIGIGRGADLVLYTWIVASMAMILALLVGQRRTNINIVKLVRELALQEAENRLSK